YVMVAPKIFAHAKVVHSVGLVEIFMALGFAGAFVLVLMKNLSKASLVANNDPYLEEGIHLHQ
ncbi:MAG: quinol:cytochrome C oxidoreductase, partial [Bdellovibrionota bacterium]